MKLLPAVAATLALAAPSASAQIAQVVINEVNFTKGDQWIELYNATTSDVNLGGWSLYHATRTANRFDDYWWGFPSATTIKGGDYLRVHWGAKLRTPPDKRDIYTGDTAWHFLFGHGFEPLDASKGALAICTTKDNKLVNAANVFSDWWQWGATGFKRESIAVGNKPVSLWNATKFLPAVAAGASLMRLDPADKFPHPLNGIREDFSPTPLLPNSAGMKVQSFGTSCGRKTVGVKLVADDFAFHGNKKFSLTVKNTQGPAFFEQMVYVVNLGKLTKLPPTFKCDVLDPAAPGFITPFFATNSVSTTLTVPLTLPGISSIPIYVQALVFGTIPTGYESLSNRLAITVSK